MQAFKTFTGIVLPIDRNNVDTDAIIPKQFLRSIKRSGFGINLFDEWRYLDPWQANDNSVRRPKPDFVLNQPRYQGAEILLSRGNFGCGSSREHAIWALSDYGIRVIIASSFADIFYSNACKNGVLPVTLEAETIAKLFTAVSATEGYALTVNLEQLKITTPESEDIPFHINAGLQTRLLNGLDDIAMTLQHTDDIKRYERQRKNEAPWLFADIDG